MNGKFLHDMLVNWLYRYSTVTVDPVLKGTCIEIPSVYKDYLEIL